MKSRGFTLVELLVAMAVFSVIFAIVYQTVDSMNKSNLIISAKNEMVKDAQIAEQLIIGRLSEAIWVASGNTSVTINNRGQAISNVTNKNNTTSGSQNWSVKTDPIVVMITPPERPDLACSAASLMGCYNYYAYLTSTREFLQAQSSFPEQSPTVDPLNQDSWVIIQYHAAMVGWEPDTNYKSGVTNGLDESSLPNQSQLANYSSAMILLEYVQPQDDSKPETLLFPEFTGAAANKPHFFSVTAPTGSTSSTVNTSDGLIDIRFRMQKRIRGLKEPVVVDGVTDTAVTTTTSPGGISYLGGTVSPRNWWR